MSSDWAAWLAARLERDADGQVIATLPRRLVMTPAQAVELAEHLGRLAAPSLPRVQAKGKPLLYRTVGPSDGLEPIRAKDVAEEAVAQMIEPKGRRPQKKKRRKGR
jgi:hypothetical protein